MKKLKSTALILFAAFAVILCGCASDSANYKQITQAEAEQMMQKESDYIILDVRTQDEYNEGHIKNAVCVPNEVIQEGDFSQLPDKEQLIFVYCRSGRRSKDAAQKLADNGYTNIYEFGGIIYWQGETDAQ